MKRNIDIYRDQSCSEEVDGRSEWAMDRDICSIPCVCVWGNSQSERYNRILDKVLKLALILGTGLYKFKLCNDPVRKTVGRV